jgi:hypothetical protein
MAVSVSTLRTALSFGALLLASTALAGPVPGARLQLELLRAMPSEVLAGITKGGAPDGHGMVGHNQQRWMGAQYQRSAADVLLFAASRGDREMAERAWTAVEVAFAHQEHDGGFASREESKDAPAVLKDVYSDNAFWLAHLSQAILVLRESPLAPAFRDRIDALMPRFRTAAHLLVGSKEALTKRERKAPNRYFFDGLACKLSGLLVSDRSLDDLGNYFIELALHMQHPSGFFVEQGGADTSYNAVSIWQLQILDLYFPAPRYDAALSRAIAWQLPRIKPDGTIDAKGNSRTGLGQERYFGKPKGINYPEVVFALLYYGYRHKDQAAIDAALRANRRRERG